MGYSHSYKVTSITDQDRQGLKKALPLIQDIIKRHSPLLCLEYDQADRAPLATEEKIQFNGKGEDGHETFVFTLKEGEEWVKTNRKPYDQAVCEVLLVLNACLPGITVDSDGFSAGLADCEVSPELDGTWMEAILSVEQYGIYYSVEITERRDPYCDMKPVLRSAPEKPLQQHVFCGICGHRALQLYDHVREVHGLTPSGYESRCPKAPLASERFAGFVLENGITHTGGVLLMNKNLFGQVIPCPLKAAGSVPEEDGEYVFDEAFARPLLLSLLENDRVLLVGHTGCGKSSLIAQIGARLNWPVRQINLDGETSVSDFVGQWIVKGSEMVYQYGILPTAMREGQMLVLEELDAADPGILFILQSVMEKKGRLVLTDKGGEIIEPHKHFRLVATANTLGLGDESGLYTGTHVLNASHLDRWTSVFQMSYLPPAEELKVVTKKVPALDRTLAESFVKLANAVRKAALEEQVFCTFSTRKLLALAEKTVSFGSVLEALKATVINRLPRSDAQVVYELAQRHLPMLERGGDS